MLTPGGIPLGVCRLAAPLSANCFLISMKLVDSQTGYEVVVAVPIPGPEADNWEELAVVKESILSEGKFQLHHVKEYGLSDGIYDGYSKSWKTPPNKN